MVVEVVEEGVAVADEETTEAGGGQPVGWFLTTIHKQAAAAAGAVRPQPISPRTTRRRKRSGGTCPSWLSPRVRTAALPLR